MNVGELGSLSDMGQAAQPYPHRGTGAITRAPCQRPSSARASVRIMSKQGILVGHHNQHRHIMDGSEDIPQPASPLSSEVPGEREKDGTVRAKRG